MSNASELRQAVIDKYFHWNSTWLWNYCTIRQKVLLSNVKQKCGPLLPGSSVNLNKLNLIEIELFIKMLYGVWSSGLVFFPTMKQTNPRTGCKSASQPGTGWQVADLKHLKTSDIFFFPRISTKDFPYIKRKTDWSIGINYSSEMALGTRLPAYGSSR